MEQELDLSFQRYAHDGALGGASPSTDGSPMKKRNRASLSPRAFSEGTGDKSLAWELEKELFLCKLGELLK